MSKKMKFTETFELAMPDAGSILKEAKAPGQDLPSVIYPEIRAITANKVTRNRTFYPSESLRGAPGSRTGVASVTYPYPIPIIKDHNTRGGMFGGETSPIYGRAKSAKFVEAGGEAYVSITAAISDPYAVQAVLDGRFMTVSIGVEAESVFCSICGANVVEAGCDHEKGHSYLVGGRTEECHWKIGPVSFQELSFVTVPSDTDARVIRTNTVNEATESQAPVSEGSTLPLLVGRDPKLCVSMPTLFYRGDRETLEHDLSDMFGLPEDLKAKALEVWDARARGEQAAPAEFVIDETTYPFLYKVMGPVWVGPTLEVPNKPNLEVAMSKPNGETAEAEVTAAVEETTDATGAAAEAVNTETAETTEAAAPAAAEVEEAAATDVTEALTLEQALEERTRLTAEISALKEELEALRESTLEAHQKAHTALAREVALLVKHLNRPLGRGKTVEALTQEFAKRTQASLEDSRSDLMAEMPNDGAPVVDTAAVESVASPVLQETETQPATKVEVDPATGKTTVDSDIQESEEDTFLVHFGIDSKTVEETLAKLAQGASLRK